jgi:hypothetical protein
MIEKLGGGAWVCIPDHGRNLRHSYQVPLLLLLLFLPVHLLGYHSRWPKYASFGTTRPSLTRWCLGLPWALFGTCRVIGLAFAQVKVL